MNVQDVGTDIEKVLLTEEQLKARIEEMGNEISNDYQGKQLLCVGVLRGAIMAMADLTRAIHVPLHMDWMAVSSYGASTKSSGVVRIVKDLDTEVAGLNILIVEDIIDSGLTLHWMRENLLSRGAAEVKIATILRKPEAAKIEVDVDYVGFDIPNEFVVGYGLDYAEDYRHLPFIGTLAKHVYGG